MEITLITVAVIVAFVFGGLVGFFAGFRFADYLNDRQSYGRTSGSARRRTGSATKIGEATDDEDHHRPSARAGARPGAVRQAHRGSTTASGSAIAMTAVSKPRRCGRRSRSCNPPSRTAASTRDDDNKGRPSSGGRLFFTIRHAIHSAMHPNQPAPHTVDWRTSGRR